METILIFLNRKGQSIFGIIIPHITFGNECTDSVRKELWNCRSRCHECCC